MDREKVIKGMEKCIQPDECSPDECPYYDRPDNSSGLCWDRLMADALALLKEQETVEPEVEVLNEIDRIYRCPKCHKHFFYEKQKYCDQCGQAVKWE